MQSLSLFGISCLIFLTLMSCKRDEPYPVCNENYLNSYNKVAQDFMEAFETGENIPELIQSLKNYLAQYNQYVCTFGKETFDLSAQAQTMLDELSSQKSIRKVIYGEDDRVEYADALVWQQNLARSVAAQIRSSGTNPLIDSRGSLVDLQGSPYGQTLGQSESLCSSERFFEQLSVANCSGFLVASDVLVTAGHCVKSLLDCERFVWAFDFHEGTTSFHQDQLYRCIEILDHSSDQASAHSSDDIADFAVLKLDRPVKNRPILRIRRQGLIGINDVVMAIGHPSGIPLKVAQYGIVRQNHFKNFFTASLDTFQGNSGSPVINLSTRLVEGILVRGEDDYIQTSSGCYAAHSCLENTCRGESANFITAIKVLDEFVPLSFEEFQTKMFKITPDFPSDNSGPIALYQYNFADQTLSGRQFFKVCALKRFKGTQLIKQVAQFCEWSQGIEDFYEEFVTDYYKTQS